MVGSCLDGLGTEVGVKGIPELSVVSHQVAVPTDVDDVAVVDQPVDESGRHHVIAKDLAPRLEALVRGEHRERVLVSPAHESVCSLIARDDGLHLIEEQLMWHAAKEVKRFPDPAEQRLHLLPLVESEPQKTRISQDDQERVSLAPGKLVLSEVRTVALQRRASGRTCA